LAISFQIDSQCNRIIFSVTDNFHFPDFFGAWRELLKHSDFQLDQTMIWDLSQMEASNLLDSDLRRIAEFMQGQTRVNGQFTQVALIAPTKATYGLASTYLNFLLEDQESFLIFRTRARGEAWLDSCSSQSKASG